MAAILSSMSSLPSRNTGRMQQSVASKPSWRSTLQYPVHRVNACRVDPHKDLTAIRPGVGTLIEPKPIASAMTVDDDRFH
jgi:hypothetical protein